MNIDFKRLGFFGVVVAIGACSGYLGQPLIHDNHQASGVIVNVFSILAGFLVTVMTLLGEPSLFRGRSWRSDAVRKSNVYRRLVRHKWLFILYLLVLGTVFVATLITKKYPESSTVIWLERIYLGLAAIAFILSLILPHRLMSLQLSRFDEMIDSKKKSGTSNSS
ncbi:hypothetical protein [Shewanella algae]